MAREPTSEKLQIELNEVELREGLPFFVGLPARSAVQSRSAHTGFRSPIISADCSR